MTDAQRSAAGEDVQGAMNFVDRRRLGERLWRGVVGRLLRIRGFTGSLLHVNLEALYTQLMDYFEGRVSWGAGAA
jgi:hypothetical protein